MEATQVPINGWTDKDVKKYIQWNTIQEGNSDPYDNKSELWKHTKWNKPVTKEQIQYYLIYWYLHAAYTVLKYIETESKVVVARWFMGVIVEWVQSLSSGKWETSGHGWWWWLHNNERVLMSLKAKVVSDSLQPQSMGFSRPEYWNG